VQSIYLVVKLFRLFKALKLDDTYDIIVKLDADLILPNNYFETIVKHFEENQRQEWPVDLLISKNGEWILENLTDKIIFEVLLKHTAKPVLNKWAD
jgi:hypothetical protein